MPIPGFQLYTNQSELVLGNGKLIEKEMYKYLHLTLGKLDSCFCWWCLSYVLCRTFFKL